MANKTHKFRLPEGKILRFTLSGKAIPEALATMEDDRRLRARLGDELYERFSEADRATLMRLTMGH